MNEPVNVTRAALVKLLDAMRYPNPDDPGDPSPPWGPYGPIGPVIGGVLRGLSWVLLNPQPLPPRDRGALQKVLRRSRTSTSSRREEVCLWQCWAAWVWRSANTSNDFALSLAA